jgi:hypothetical protein
VFTILTLLLLTLEAWGPRLVTAGGPQRGSAPVPAPVERPGIDAAGIAERVSHTPVPVAGRPGTLEVKDEAYRATFDAAGFSYTPTGGARPLGISLERLSRDRTSIDPADGTWSAESNVAVREVAPGVSERATARYGEVEWDVVLAAAPRGAGDLVVSSRLTGMAGAPVRVDTADGPAWRIPLAGGEAVLLDELVVKDAAGKELHRALPTISGDSVALVVPAPVLESAAYPLTLDPTVSGPSPLVTGGGRPNAAFDGTNFLVVWEQVVGGDADIVGARVRTNGTILSGPFQISTSTVGDLDPDVAWNGNNFLVVWEFRVTNTQLDIRARTVNPDGALLGNEIFVSSAAGIQWLPNVAAGGSTWFVVWTDQRNGADDVFGTRVNGFSQVLDPAGVPLTGTTAGTDFLPDIAWNGTTFLVVWQNAFNPTTGDHDIFGRRVNRSTGSPIDSAIPISTPTSFQGQPTVASDGSGFFVVWEDNRNGSGLDVFGGRVDANGTPLSGTGFVVGGNVGDQMDPVLAFNGNYLVAWRDGRDGGSDRDIYGTVVNTAGAVQQPEGLIIAAATDRFEANAGVGAGGGNWVVIYESRSSTAPTDLVLRRVSPK